jgi:hypothetical protein
MKAISFGDAATLPIDRRLLEAMVRLLGERYGDPSEQWRAVPRAS